uniref:Photosystem I reaction center subunit VIII n=1 Tax=Sporolithon durum TaxID=48970 RepID=A0A141SCZ1_9FLOR|nr:photosystem I subunit VIII [Sporolithon durum]AMK96159.1 photosystem I subunit VIII [Sporolithon durum]
MLFTCILVPLVGIIFPGISMALLFIYIEQDNIT